MKTKKFYQSWTFWVNFIGGAIMLVQELAHLELISAKAAAVILIVANIVLRFKTDSEIKA